MSEKDSRDPKRIREDQRDDFWNVERLIPERRERGVVRRPRPTPSAVEIEVPATEARASQGAGVASASLTVTPTAVPVERTHSDARPSVEPLTIHDLLAPETGDEPTLSSPRHPAEDRGVAETASTVHYIPPHSPEEGKDEQPLLDYRPDGVLLHRVQVFAWASGFHYFDQFATQAAEYATRVAPPEAQRVSFFSYFPQYVQMNRRQCAWYLHWREAARGGSYLDTDYAYILLYIFELINLAAEDGESARTHRDALASVWMAYRRTYPQLDRYMCEWLCDYCLIHELPAPLDILAPALDDIILGSRLKEFYLVSVIIPEAPTAESTASAAAPNAAETRHRRRNLATARILMRHCCQYDYHKSKFASGEHKELFDRTIPSAIAATLPLLLGSEEHPPVITMQDSTVTRDAFTGALCSYQFKRKITVSYTSFSRSHDLRFLIGDMVKHVENTLRSWIGVRSKLSVMALPTPLREALDAYLAPLAPKKEMVQPKKKEPVRPAYEALYDLPRKEISLADAAAIEASSWETTRILTEAFGGRAEGEMQTAVPEDESGDTSWQTPLPMTQTPPTTAESDATAAPSDARAPSASDTPSSPLAAALGELIPFLRAALNSDRDAQRAYAASVRKMPDAIADEINAITTEVEIYDMVLEEDGRGGYGVIEDYREMLQSI